MQLRILIKTMQGKPGTRQPAPKVEIQAISSERCADPGNRHSQQREQRCMIPTLEHGSNQSAQISHGGMRIQAVGEVKTRGDAEACQCRFERPQVRVASAQDDSHFAECAAARPFAENPARDLFGFAFHRGGAEDTSSRLSINLRLAPLGEVFRQQAAMNGVISGPCGQRQRDSGSGCDSLDEIKLYFREGEESIEGQMRRQGIQITSLQALVSQTDATLGKSPVNVTEKPGEILTEHSPQGVYWRLFEQGGDRAMESGEFRDRGKAGGREIVERLTDQKMELGLRYRRERRPLVQALRQRRYAIGAHRELRARKLMADVFRHRRAGGHQERIRDRQKQIKRRARFPDAAGPVIKSEEGARLLFSRKFRRQVCHHLLELGTLVRVQDLKDAGFASGAQVVKLLLQAFVILGVVVQHQRELLGLRS